MGWVAKDPIGKIEKKIFEILILSVWKYVEKPQNAPIRPTLPYQEVGTSSGNHIENWK